MARPVVLLLAAVQLASLPLEAQVPRTVTADDYARAEERLGPTANRLVFGTGGRPHWLAGDRFWYENPIPDGTEIVLVDPAHRTRARAFDHSRMAAALSAAADTTYSAWDLPIARLGDQAVVFSRGQREFQCDLQATRCAESRRPPRDRRAIVSPDSTRAAFVRDHNLWVRDLATGRETQLTTDGQPEYGYATNNAGWTKSDVPVLLWSPDSKRIATFQHDARGVGMMYLVSSRVGHPELQAWKYPLPGDSLIFRIERVVIDVTTGKVTRFQMPPDPHRSTICDHVFCNGQWADVEWYPDGSHVAFVSTSRDHKQANLRIADAATGVVRDVLEEKVATQYESGADQVSWRVLPATNEVIWYSERDDWGNLYLYDLATGRLKRQITKGPGPVLDLVRVDEKNRLLYFLAGGKEPGENPYFRHLYRIDFDGKQQERLTPEPGNHVITLAPDGRYFVDTWSTPTTPPVTVLRDERGRVVLPLEKADIGRLVASGWIPPIPFTTKARDGVTDLYGLLYRPGRFDSTRTYPVVNYLYPGPQSGSVGFWGFAPARGDKQALAELGFVVIEVDAMGTPGRSKSFHDVFYGNMGDNGLPDQVATIRQLGARYPWIDLDRVGIWGHSGGGFAAADGILRYPDFYKVAISEAGNHDNRTYEDDWGERYQGLLTRHPDGTTNYDNQANQLLAQNLKGKLLIAHGTLDDNVPPNNTLVLVNALMAANKDFDLLLLPNRRHGFANEPYMIRRRWDYFVRNLMGAEPPKDYEIGAKRPSLP